MKLAKEARKSRPIRMTDAEWAKCKALGGAAFVRAKIKAAKVVSNVKVRGAPPERWI